VAYNNRSYAYSAKGEHDRAIADATKAIELDPKLANKLASLLKSLQRPAAAAIPAPPPASPAVDTSPTASPSTAVPVAAATPPPNPPVAATAPAVVPVAIAPPSPPAAAAAVSQQSPLEKGKRIALVIGNSQYRNVAGLDNPVNDARLMAEALKALGFKLVGDGPQLDLDKAGFDSVVQKFGNELLNADVGLFYYAGHAVQVRGSNYLIPIGANPTREADVDFQMVDVNLVLRQMEGSRTKLNVVMLDACRNNPFGGRGLRSSSGGLAQMQAPEGTLISYATQPGGVAQDDGGGGNSPYTKALAETIRKPGLDVFETFNEVGLVVKRATGSQQQPWLASSPIEGAFYFAGK
jgi:hypothetical protein